MVFYKKISSFFNIDVFKIYLVENLCCVSNRKIK